MGRISASAPLNHGLVVATATGTDGSSLLLKSDDSGATWTATPSAVTSPTPVGDGGTILGVLENRIQRSADGGGSWTSVGPNIPWDSGSVWGQFLLADPMRPGYVWLCDTNGSAALAWQSGDAGITWSPQRRSDDCRPGAIQPGGTHILLATDEISPTESVIYRSSNGGRRWKRLQIPHEVPITSVAFDATRPSVVVVAARNLNGAGNVDPTGFWTIWRSTDAGSHWYQVWRVPAARCPVGVGSCAKYGLGSPFTEPSPVFANKRFVLGPFGRVGRSSETSRGAQYLISSQHGLRWRLVAAPYASSSKRIDLLPQTGPAVPTTGGLIAQGKGRPPNLTLFWRLGPSATAWQREQFVVTGTAPSTAAATTPPTATSPASVDSAVFCPYPTGTTSRVGDAAYGCLTDFSSKPMAAPLRPR